MMAGARAVSCCCLHPLYISYISVISVICLYHVSLTYFIIHHHSLKFFAPHLPVEGTEHTDVVVLGSSGHQRERQRKLLPAAILLDEGMDAHQLVEG
jgi:hypothetical protein